jgi:hypothetical protein
MQKIFFLSIFYSLPVFAYFTTQEKTSYQHFNINNIVMAEQAATNNHKATLGGGCYWCVEAILQRLVGVSNLKSGFTGGTVKNPTYEQVCQGTTGHAEVVQLDFDPA